MKHSIFTILFLSISACLHGALAEQSGIQAGAEQCGIQAGGALCHNNLCCSKWGFCGNTAPYCGDGCQSQCPSPPSPPLPVPPPPSPSPPPPSPSPPPPPPSPPPPSPSPPPPVPPSPPSPCGGGVASIISSAVFDQLLMHRNDPTCPARGFYRYEDFIAAANKFVGFGTTGDLITRKREIAAFLAQTSFQTRGRQWERAPDGRYTWGYCIVDELAPTWDYCVPSVKLFACVPGKKYYGRGPIQLTYNYNYGQAGEALGVDLLRDPDLVATNGTISFETALWFWMTPQTPTPSCHDVITDNWIPSHFDQQFGRFPGYGVITNIINGRLECGGGPNRNVLNRIGFYVRYCDILGVSYGDNLDCFYQRPFNWPRLSARAVE